MRQTFDAPSVSRFPAVPMQFSLSQVEGATWTHGPHAGLRARDLGLSSASKDQLGGQQFRTDAAGQAARWDASSVTMSLLYVTGGALTFHESDGSSLTLKPGDCAYQDITTRDIPVSWTADFEAFELTLPRRGAVVPPFETLDIPAAPTGVHIEGPDSYKADGGPRTFFVYRGLGSAEATGGRIHIHVVRAIGQMEGGTGWHVHSMSQMFYVVEGWVDISVDGEPNVRMFAGDAMCLAQGTRHDVAGFSPTYTVFELCLPAEYSTIPTPAPLADAAA